MPDDGKNPEIEKIKPGEGAVLTIDGQQVAVYKNDSGEVMILSAVCTHLGCMVEWSSAEKTWDCPCHGSRYEPDGRVKQGPSEEPLKKIEI